MNLAMALRFLSSGSEEVVKGWDQFEWEEVRL